MGTRLVEGFEPPPDCRPEAGFAAVLRHERIPFLSWPFEWPFSMLKDAALLTLELIDAALDEGLILKDGTPYNVQWRGAAPVFIDVGSFERLGEGEPWFGYRQFCMQFLYPLMLRSFRDVSHRPLLRGELEGISPEQMRNLLSLRDRLRRGVLTNVVLHARLERRHSDRSATDAREEVSRAGFKPELIKANVGRLAKLIRGLDWKPAGSEWSEYRETSTYDEEGLAAKEAFVEAAVASAAPALVWDLGCNDGRFSRIAADAGAYVVAIDGDEVAVDRLYRELRAEGSDGILPLAVDLVDASPGLGWRGEERPPLERRAKPDLVLALALVHHLAIGANVPLPRLSTGSRASGRRSWSSSRPARTRWSPACSRASARTRIPTTSWSASRRCSGSDSKSRAASRAAAASSSRPARGERDLVAAAAHGGALLGAAVRGLRQRQPRLPRARSDPRPVRGRPLRGRPRDGRRRRPPARAARPGARRGRLRRGRLRPLPVPLRAVDRRARQRRRSRRRRSSGWPCSPSRSAIAIRVSRHVLAWNYAAVAGPCSSPCRWRSTRRSS